MRTIARLAVPAVGLALAAAVSLPAAAGDRHAGYYYPENKTTEEYTARSKTIDDVDRAARIRFVTNMTRSLLDKPYPPQFVIYAKGEFAQKMIIASTYEGAFNTLYRMRALLAMMTAVARESEVFNQYGVEDYFTFFDLLHLLGFTQLTVTDGDSFAHQVHFK